MNHSLAAASEVLAAQKGDEASLRSLWQQHRRWVAAILLAHKPRHVDVEDLLQDVAATMVSRISELRDPAAFKPWLRMVAVNAARAQGRGVTRRRETRLESAEALSAGASPPEQLREREEARRILSLALQLPDSYREPLLLRCVHGMSHREIGRVLDLPETTIETRIARGRRMLRDLAAKDQQSASSNTSGSLEVGP